MLRIPEKVGTEVGKIKVDQLRILLDLVPRFTSLTILFFVATAGANDGRSSTQNRSDSPKKLYSLQAINAAGQPVDLPKPPPELGKLLETGQVTIEFYDPKVSHHSFAGETHFEYQYTYDARSDWKRKDQDGKPGIEISIRYNDIRLQLSHRILLPQEMIGEDLFERSLTLHEFDHVRISADIRLAKLLEKMLKERNAVVTKVLDEEADEFSGKPTAKDFARISKRMVKEESDRVFDDFVAVVSIRYQELDRTSNYGRMPLSQDDRLRIIESEPKPSE